MLQISSNSLLKRYLRDLSLTGLYPNSIPGAAHAIIQEEIRRQLAAGTLTRYDSYSPDGDDEGPEAAD